MVYLILQEATPELEELNLLVDAIKQLDELFLLVIVGEFNSGKSSIINALLGDKFLAEGILPTTNEISVLKFRCTTFGNLRNHNICLLSKVLTSGLGSFTLSA